LKGCKGVIAGLSGGDRGASTGAGGAAAAARGFDNLGDKLGHGHLDVQLDEVRERMEADVAKAALACCWVSSRPGVEETYRKLLCRDMMPMMSI
jgi:hypothetical protein